MVGCSGMFDRGLRRIIDGMMRSNFPTRYYACFDLRCAYFVPAGYRRVLCPINSIERSYISYEILKFGEVADRNKCRVMTTCIELPKIIPEIVGSRIAERMAMPYFDDMTKR